MDVASWMTLEEFLNDDDRTEQRYELVDGVLVEMPPESDRNNRIALFLLAEFLKIIPLRLIRHKDTEIVVTGGRARVRLPDLLVLTDELAQALRDQRRGTITPDMPPPSIVVEVVSPGTENENRDYRYKRSEYAARGIAEYWIVDPEKAQVTLLMLVDGFYEAAVLTGSDVIRSLQLPVLQITINQIMQAGE